MLLPVEIRAELSERNPGRENLYGACGEDQDRPSESQPVTRNGKMEGNHCGDGVLRAIRVKDSLPKSGIESIDTHAKAFDSSDNRSCSDLFASRRNRIS